MKSTITRTIALIVVLAMIIAPVGSLVAKPVSANEDLPWRRDLKPTGHTPVEKFSAVDATEIVDMTEVSRYIVMFEGASLTTAKGGSAINSVEGQSYLNTLAVNRQSVLAKAEGLLGRAVKVRHVYDVILNAVSVELSVQEAEKLQSLEGIRSVLRDQDYTYTTDAGPAWIGAGAVWDGSATPGTLGTKGEGILVGIIDTGINFDHPSFSDTPADGYTYTWNGDYLGVCAPDGDPAYANACNKKLVGAWSYTSDALSETVTPEDSEGHGSHTASTVAGNTVTTDFYGSEVTISGVAPHAQIVAYDVCYPAGSGGACAGEDSVAAIQQAILDEVDVINYSISGGENPYSDAVELAFLEATKVGITVSASAGNSGPGAETVAHRSPWLLSTAATTHNRKFSSFVNFSNTEYQNITTLAGEIPFTTAVVDSPVKFGGEDNNPLGCANPGYTDNFYNGAIALVKRGTCTFSEKILTAEAAGALGVLIFTDNRAPGVMSVSGTNIPAVMLNIPGSVGDAIAAWVASETGETVSISAFGADYSDAYADIVANFSSRGPNTTFDVLKPDIAAPGVEILAAVADGTIDPDSETELDLLQGTSMASPHDAGAAALLAALHPDWTPAEIKSALMLTAYDGLLKEDKTTPADAFDIGAGRVKLELAGLTGLVMDETYDNYVAADPAKGGDVRTLNIPSVYNSSCVGECSWTRTFKSVADMPATYTAVAPAFVTVDPATFTINPGATQKVTITADVSALTPDEWVFGNIEFQTDDSHAGTTLLREGFESGTIPTTWTVVNEGDQTPWLVGGSTGSVVPHSGNYMAWHGDNNINGADSTWLISPVLSIPEGTTSLRFWEENNYMGYAEDLGHTLWVSTGSCVLADGVFTLLANYSNSPNLSAWEERTVDLSSYAGKNICLAWRYYGDWASQWYIDDISVTNAAIGTPISDVAIPLAVLPTTGNLPALVKFDSHRDAGMGTIVDLQAVEITALTVNKYGWVKGVKNEIQLAEDPTPGDPFDDMSQVWYTVVPMDAGAARLIAEVTATTAIDLDLFWGFDVNGDGIPQEDEEYGRSTTPTAFEYLTEWGFSVDFYDIWIMVQNWQGSGAEKDDITLTIGYVPYEPIDPENMDVNGPQTNPAGELFSLDVLWHDIDTEEGDRLYGLIDVHADNTGEAARIGVIQLDVVRKADDVVKTANVAEAKPGDTITYTIEITNYTTDPITYTINDVLPEGVTYVPGSVTGGAVYDGMTNAITWNGEVDSSRRDYVMTTSISDSTCAMPLANSGAYVDLSAFGVALQQEISGEDTWKWTVSGDPITFYGQDVGNDLFITDDGYAYLAGLNEKPLVNADIPTADLPNNLLAFFWRDLVVNYDATLFKGISLVNLTDDGGIPIGHIVEMDDVNVKGNTAQTYDIEMYLAKTHDDAAGEFEVIFAYDNIVGPLDIGTVGIENGDGSVGVKFAYNDAQLATLTNGSAICFDWTVVPAPPKMITFQVTVDEDVALGALTNTALHTSSQAGTVEEGAVAIVMIPAVKNLYLPVILK